MNKKSKNKKCKVPNPCQEEKKCDKLDLKVIGDEGNLAQSSEIIKSVEVIADSVKEERVPEIISEIIPSSVEIEDEETPKKPKRNRNKKKKGKEDDSEHNVPEEPKELVKKPVLEQKDDNVLEIETLEGSTIEPTIRKKNKKKDVEQKTEPPIPSGSEQVTKFVTTTDSADKLKVKEIEEETPIHADAGEQGVKISKKKNKKKKRNDSEKSGKEELSCTAAFQDLIVGDRLESKVEESEVIKGALIKSEPDTTSVIEKDIELKDIDVEKNRENRQDISLVKELEEQQPLENVLQSKSKKKKKKDKKPLQTEEPIVTSNETLIGMSSLSIDTSTEDGSKDNKNIEKSDIVQESSPKPKAKIVKPVEKKLKGNNNKQSDEIGALITKSILPEQPPPVISESTEVKVTEQETLSHSENKRIQKDCTQKPIETNVQKHITSPDQCKELKYRKLEPESLLDEAMDNNSKKILVIPKTSEIGTFESKAEINMKPAESEMPYTREGVLMETNIRVIQKPETSVEDISRISIISDTHLESKHAVDVTPLPCSQEHVLLTPETVCSQEQAFLITNTLEEKNTTNLETLTVDKTENVQKKSVKRRKKSPKPPRKEEHKHTEPAIQVITPTQNTLPTSEESAKVEEKLASSIITSLYDIEISTLKVDEAKGITCDTVPDITYPRSLSELLSDNNNNNTVITEIIPSPEIIPPPEIIPSPEILLDEQKQKSVETIKTGVGVVNKETTSPPREEKTDIKSKMMEVNQDMEELRLSIERSLAEFSTMEKNAEKPCAESSFKVEQSWSKLMQTDTIQCIGDVEDTYSTSDKQKGAENKTVEQFEKAEDSSSDDRKNSININSQKISLTEPQSQLTECSTESKSEELHTEEMKNILSTIGNVEKDLVTSQASNIHTELESLTEKESPEEIKTTAGPHVLSIKSDAVELIEMKREDTHLQDPLPQPETIPVCPARKDNKNKHKKKKGKQDVQITSQPTQTTTTSQSATTIQETKKNDKSDSKSEKKSESKDIKGTGKQQSSSLNSVPEEDGSPDLAYEPIDDFEDALTSSVDDVNQTFELIVKETQEQSNPKIDITTPVEEKTPISPPKNLLGHPDIPVSSNKRDYKKEKDKIPNEITATVDIKDSTDVERKQSKNTQTINKLKDLKNCKLNGNDDFVYKYSFRKVFLQSACHVCKKELIGARLACSYCNLVFYCGIKHKDEDWPLHQALCFAVSTIGHLKDQKYIYGDIKNVSGQDYRLIRMQMIVSCEKVVKRRLVPWEQEALLYPRVCAHMPCREWRQAKLSDCRGCGQISFCTNNQDHYPKAHSRWCKSYSLYQKLVCYQQTKGRLEPRLPTKVMQDYYEIPEKINEVLAAMYEEKIDMNDIQYAALTQIATAPLTAAYCHQLCRTKNCTTNGYKKSILTIHVVGAELQFEADALNKWEVFFLHLRPDLQELRIVLINYNLNPSNLPLELLGKIKLCDQCHQDKRRVVLDFQDKRTYADYKMSEDFIIPDIVCAFNPSIQRSSVYNGKDPWPSTVNVILKQKIPFIITSYTITELQKDCMRIKECSEVEYKFISEPKMNNFASVRPDRNFITDDEIPLLFKNYCYTIICG